MTFSVPSELAELFLKRVPARSRSRFLAEALSKKLSERDRRLALSCEMANRQAEVGALEKELDELQDAVTEPWDDSAKR